MKDIKFLLFFLISVFAYCMLIGLQGFDMCDEGWELTGFQQIFNDPASVTYQFLYYNTLLVGGVWQSLLGCLGYYGFRILSALFITGTAFFVYLILRGYINHWFIFLTITT